MFTLEVVLWAPIFAFMFIFAGVVIRVSLAATDASGAAADAARAVSLYRGSDSAQSVAQAAADQSLTDAGVSCSSVNVVTTGNIQPGGVVTVSVSCIADLSDIAVPGIPGTHTLTSVASSPIDRTRSQ